MGGGPTGTGEMQCFRHMWGSSGRVADFFGSLRTRGISSINVYAGGAVFSPSDVPSGTSYYKGGPDYTPYALNTSLLLNPVSSDSSDGVEYA